MKKIISRYFLTLTCFTLFDLLWLGILMQDFYREELGHLMRLGADGNLDTLTWAAAAFYLLLPLGFLFFVFPRVENKNRLQKFGVGALYGFVLYMTYDFTNLAVLKDWPLLMSVVDILWGTTLGGLITLSVFKIEKTLNLFLWKN